MMMYKFPLLGRSSENKGSDEGGGGGGGGLEEVHEEQSLTKV